MYFTQSLSLTYSNKAEHTLQSYAAGIGGWGAEGIGGRGTGA